MNSEGREGNVFEAPEEKVRAIAKDFGVKIGKKKGALETFTRQLAFWVSIQSTEKRQEFRKKWGLPDAFGEFPKDAPKHQRPRRLKVYTDLL